MIGYHVTTPKKLEKYESTGAILPPVRFWPNAYSAKRWAKRVNRSAILKISVDKSHPLPDHKPAEWTPEIVRDWELVDEND